MSSSCFNSPNQRLLAVSLLDCTVKVFFADTLKVCSVYYMNKIKAYIYTFCTSNIFVQVKFTFA